jgi:hypothetical protein
MRETASRGDRAIEEDKARGIIRPRRPVQADIDLN